MILIIGRRWPGLITGLALVLVTGACAPSQPDSEGPVIVATTTILGDVAANVVGNAATVKVLMPVGTDPHAFQASSQDAALLAGADLVVANGLGLEEGLADVLDSVARDGTPVISVGPLLAPLPLRGDSEGRLVQVLDPHVWMDPLRMADAADLIAAELESLLPGKGWGVRADAYRATLIATDTEIRSILDVVPPMSRRIVTNHDSLGYFANRYGFEIIGAVIPGGSTLAEPSSADLASLVAAMRTAGVTTIFAETTEPTVLADALAKELGSNVGVVELYTGSLGISGSGADTLTGMLITNATRIAGALVP